MSAELIGRKFGDYVLTDILGRGGMATVYRGYQASIDRSVAIKILPAEYHNDSNFGKRFVQEARALSKLTHPAIVSLYEFGQQDDLLYIVMPLMTSDSLVERLKQGQPMDYLSLLGQRRLMKYWSIQLEELIIVTSGLSVLVNQDQLLK